MKNVLCILDYSCFFATAMLCLMIHNLFMKNDVVAVACHVHSYTSYVKGGMFVGAGVVPTNTLDLLTS